MQATCSRTATKQQSGSQRFLQDGLATQPLEQHPPLQGLGDLVTISTANSKPGEIQRVPGQNCKVYAGINAVAVITEQLAPLPFYMAAAEKQGSCYTYGCSKKDFIAFILRQTFLMCSLNPTMKLIRWGLVKARRISSTYPHCPIAVPQGWG